MWATTLITTILIGAGAVTGRPGWHLDGLYPLASEQLDSIVSPNAQSSHMHRIFGECSRVLGLIVTRLAYTLPFHIDS